MKLTKNIIILAILIILALIINGKYFFSNSENSFLFVYGITITSVILFTILISFLRYKDPYEETLEVEKKPKEKPLVSCILAVFNEQNIIENCVNSLLNSTYQNKEIIVVNDASTDKTQKVLAKFESKGVKVINLPVNKGKKKAIAEGIKIAKGDIYVFTDSDSVVAEDAIEKIIEIFIHDSEVGAVSGHARALNANENILTKIQDTWYETQFCVEKAFESSFNVVSCVSGPLAVFRKEAVYNYIPAWTNDKFLGKEFKFATDRQLTGYVLGSTVLEKKLKKKYFYSSFVNEINYPARKWKVLYCKSAKVWTIIPNTLKKLIRQQIRWKKSFVRNLFFTGTFYWRKPVIPALKFYLSALFTLIGPIIAFRHLIYLPINGNYLSGVFYLSGILFIGSVYGLIFKLENPGTKKWIFRPFMSLLSTLLISWLIFFSIFTIRKNKWYRG